MNLSLEIKDDKVMLIQGLVIPCAEMLVVVMDVDEFELGDRSRGETTAGSGPGDELPANLEPGRPDGL